MISHCLTVDFEDDATPEIEDIPFNSNQSFLGNDVIIIDANRLLRHYRSSIDGTHDGRPFLSPLESHAGMLRRDIERRKREVTTLLSSGSVVVVTTPPDTVVYVKSADQSGVDRNRTRVETLDPLSILPASFTAETAAGKAVAPCAGEPFKSFFDANAGRLRYDGVLTQAPGGKALAHVRGTTQIVAVYFHAANGHVVILPRSTAPLKFTPDGERVGDPLWPYFRSVLELATSLRESREAALPAWTSRYLLPGESEQILAVDAAEARLRNAESDLASEAAKLAGLRHVKHLFSADGRTLELAVEECLRELGFSIEPTEPNRADIVGRHGRSVIAVEVKGVTKSAAEHHAAELEKWVSSYNEGRGRRPKGILVINAFRNKPLIERANLQAFPDQMLKWSIAREHCLVTGLQLLGITLHARHDPSSIPRLRKSLLECVGRYVNFSDFNTFIERKDG